MYSRAHTCIYTHAHTHTFTHTQGALRGFNDVALEGALFSPTRGPSQFGGGVGAHFDDAATMDDEIEDELLAKKAANRLLSPPQVCFYIYVYINIPVCIYMWIYLYTYTCGNRSWIACQQGSEPTSTSSSCLSSCLCVHIYIYININVNVYTYIYTYIHIREDEKDEVPTNNAANRVLSAPDVCFYIYVYTYLYACIHVSICMYIYINMRKKSMKCLPTKHRIDFFLPCKCPLMLMLWCVCI